MPTRYPLLLFKNNDMEEQILGIKLTEIDKKIAKTDIDIGRIH